MIRGGVCLVHQFRLILELRLKASGVDVEGGMGATVDVVGFE